MFENKVLMITGGTGSFGHAVLQRFLTSGVREIRIFSRDEKKQEDMRLKFNNSKIRFFIGDVRDYDSVCQATRGVDFIFHAAALKQVPSCEFYPLEALRTNVLGTENVLNASVCNRVTRVVVLSTDKAVYPINAMGLSKALAEKVTVAKARTQQPGDPIFCITRYGNVMGSRGSVIPLFLSQLLSGEPITLTDPKMTRFLMSLEDSVDLVLQAFEHGLQGDTFVKKAPATSVADLAQALMEISNRNSEIRIIGTRHGEKLFESLVSREEMARVVDSGSFYRIPMDDRDLNYAKYFSEGEELISKLEDYTSHNTYRLNVSQLKTLLADIEFVKERLNA